MVGVSHRGFPACVDCSSNMFQLSTLVAEVLTVGWLLAEAVRRLSVGESISEIYNLTDTWLLDARFSNVQEDMQ